MRLLKFKKKQFEDQKNCPSGWHVINEAKGQQGEFTLCGTAFDGDGISIIEPEYKDSGKITCVHCIAIIKFCKALKP